MNIETAPLRADAMQADELARLLETDRGRACRATSRRSDRRVSAPTLHSAVRPAALRRVLAQYQDLLNLLSLATIVVELS